MSHDMNHHQLFSVFKSRYQRSADKERLTPTPPLKLLSLRQWQAGSYYLLQVLAVPLITGYLNASFAANCPVTSLKTDGNQYFHQTNQMEIHGSRSQFGTSLCTVIHHGQYWMD